MPVTNIAEPEPTGWFKWVLSIVFLAFSLKYGYTAFQITAFVVVLGILAILAWFVKADDEDMWEEFKPFLLDNDWVFWALLGLTVLSGAMWYVGLNGKPVVDINPLDWIFGSSAKNTGYNPYACRGLRGLYFGCDGSWGKVFWNSLFWTIVAWPVSFVDNWLEAKKTTKMLKDFLKAQSK
ncbi:hypothetical protein HYW73_02675 [Candidatus Nomurabacteria bacterium]|nr:hypothetical protein [Candidatus Nomurabacteria bacterium]